MSEDTRTPEELFVDSLVDNEKRLAIAIKEGMSVDEIKSTIGFDEAQIETMTTRLATFNEVDVAEEETVDAPAPTPEAPGQSITSQAEAEVTTPVTPEAPVVPEVVPGAEVTPEVSPETPAEVATPEAPVAPETPAEPVG